MNWIKTKVLRLEQWVEGVLVARRQARTDTELNMLKGWIPKPRSTCWIPAGKGAFPCYNPRMEGRFVQWDPVPAILTPTGFAGVTEGGRFPECQ